NRKRYVSIIKTTFDLKKYMANEAKRRFYMRKTKIVCTIGPASESEEVLTQLIDAGMNVARLNFSHGDHAEHQQRIERIRKVAREKGKVIGILLDTRGPEIRTHSMKDGQVHIERGKQMNISMAEVEGTSEVFSRSEEHT